MALHLYFLCSLMLWLSGWQPGRCWQCTLTFVAFPLLKSLNWFLKKFNSSTWTGGLIAFVVLTGKKYWLSILVLAHPFSLFFQFSFDSFKASKAGRTFYIQFATMGLGTELRLPNWTLAWWFDRWNTTDKNRRKKCPESESFPMALLALCCNFLFKTSNIWLYAWRNERQLKKWAWKTWNKANDLLKEQRQSRRGQHSAE